MQGRPEAQPPHTVEPRIARSTNQPRLAPRPLLLVRARRRPNPAIHFHPYSSTARKPPLPRRPHPALIRSPLMRHALFIFSVALVAATVLSGCNETKVAQDGTSSGTSANRGTDRANELQLPSGTSIDITLATALTSETASVGSAWTGSTRNAVMVDGTTVIPTGSQVSGT